MAINKFCTQCGVKLELGLKFCTECGQALDEAGSPPESVAARMSSKANVAAVSEDAPAGALRVADAKPLPASPQAKPNKLYVPASTAKTAKPVEAPIVKAPIEPLQTLTPPSPSGREDLRTKEASGKRNYLLIGLVTLAIIGAGGFFLTGRNSPQATLPGKSGKSEPAPNVPASAPANKDAEAEATAKVPEAAEVLKLVMAMIEAIRTKDELGAQKALDVIKQMPVPQRGDRASARAANTAGLAKLQANELVGAITSFREGIAADPSDVEIVNNLGYALSLADKESDAIEMFAKAISLAPDRSSAWANLALSFAKTGQMDKGVAAYLWAYRFSKNQEKTKSFLTKQSEEASDERERDLAQRVLKAID